MSIKKPIPEREVRGRRLCPVCKQPSYSASGTHPQCMQRNNDILAKKAAAVLLAPTG